MTKPGELSLVEYAPDDVELILSALRLRAAFLDVLLRGIGYGKRMGEDEDTLLPRVHTRP
jgi:hypothetical protein